MKTAEKLTDEANKKICSGEILQNLKPAAGKEFSAVGRERGYERDLR